MGRTEAAESQAGITITLSRSEALVLDHLLGRWHDSDDQFSLSIDHDAEWHVLAEVRQILLAKLLLAYSQNDYTGQIAAAREEVIAFWGPVDELRDSPGGSTSAP